MNSAKHANHFKCVTTCKQIQTNLWHSPAEVWFPHKLVQQFYLFSNRWTRLRSMSMKRLTRATVVGQCFMFSNCCEKRAQCGPLGTYDFSILLLCRRRS